MRPEVRGWEQKEREDWRRAGGGRKNAHPKTKGRNQGESKMRAFLVEMGGVRGVSRWLRPFRSLFLRFVGSLSKTGTGDGSGTLQVDADLFCFP
jgi:hypothetical protein